MQSGRKPKPEKSVPLSGMDGVGLESFASCTDSFLRAILCHLWGGDDGGNAETEKIQADEIQGEGQPLR